MQLAVLHRDRAMAFLMRYRMRITLFAFAAFLMEDIIQGVQPHAVTDMHDPVGWVGGLLVLFGALTRSWAAGVIHKENSLATSGPYSLCRHPLYLGSFTMALGACMIIGDAENYLLMLGVILLLYLPKIRFEETALAAKFGEQWRNYTARTSLLVPVPGARTWHRGWSARQWLHNKEYKALVASVAVLSLLQIWHLT